MDRQNYLKPWIFGIILALIIILSEAILKIYPPSAYAFCLSGHTRDMINSVINQLTDSRFPQTFLSRKYLILTSPAVILGAWIAARIHGERRKQKGEKRILSFFLGFAVMLIGIAVYGCPVRIVIRTGYGEWYGIIAFLGLLAGIIVATVMMRLRWMLKD